MKFRIFTVALAFVMAFYLVSCDKSGGEEEKSASGSGGNSANGSGTNEVTTSDVNSGVVSENGKFDIETVRKNIYYKDNRFEIPITLGELKTLDEKWGYSNLKYGDEFYDEDGLAACEITYDGEIAFNAALENYYSNNEDTAVIYGISVKNTDVSVDGISVETTDSESVLKKYGEPSFTGELAPGSNGYVYSFGYRKLSIPSVKSKSHGITISFVADTNIVRSISLDYQTDFKGE
jgi:hypothetical protein